MLKKWFLIFALVLNLGLIWAQGYEDFSEANLPTNYSDGSFIGNDGFTWTYGHSRDPENYPIEDEGLMLRRASDSYLMATIPGGIGNFSFQYRKAYTGASARNLELIINDVQVGTSGVFGNVSGADETIHTFSLENINAAGMVQVKIKLVGSATGNAQCVIDNIEWTGFEGEISPTIFVTGVLSPFTTLEGIASTSQFYTVSGIALSAPIQITAPTGFAISLNEDEDYQNTFSLSPIDGTVSDIPIYVRLTGAAEGTYEGDITHTSTNADTKYMPAEGTVFAAVGDGYYVDFEGEGETKTSYASATVNLSGLDWNMTDVLIGTDAADFKNGLRAARFRGYATSSMTMLQDKENGLGSLSFLYRKYGNDAVVAWIVEYSADGGNEWIQIGEPFTPAAEVQSFSEEVNAGGGVRIRFRTEATGSSNRRMGMDDILLTDYATSGTPIIHISGEIDPLANISGNPSEELGQYQLWGENLSASIHITAPEHFEIATSEAGPWISATTVASSFEGTIYVRLNSSVIGEHSGNILHTSGSAEPKSIRVEGETFAPDGELTIENNMLPFEQEPGTPSPAQSYHLSGIGLNVDTEIATQAPFELSLDGVSGWTQELSVPNTFNGLIYVRLNGDTPGAFYEEHPIIHTNPSIEPLSIFVSGSILPTAMQNLFFSEYIEGTSNNKAIEIFNASGMTVDLSEYKVELYANGASTPTNTLVLSGNLTAGGVYVISHASAAADIQNVSDINGSVANFNGDDALALVHVSSGEILDVFGTIGFDPGIGWDVAGITNATLDHTLIRKPDIMQGTTNWALQAGTNENDSQWIVMPVNYFDNLGIHNYAGAGELTASPSFDPPAGFYVDPVSVSISSITAGASIRYTTDGSDPSATEGTLYTAPISISATTTLKAIAFAAGLEPSFIASAQYRFPTPVANIAELRSMPTGANNVFKLTGEAILTYQNTNRNTKYIQDNSAAIVIDDMNGIITTQYNLYDGITGIAGYLNLYSGLLQFVPVVNAPAAISSGNVIVPEIRTLASLTPADQAKLIKVKNLEFAIQANPNFLPTAQNINISDPSGAAILRTFVNTDYAGTSIPTEAVDLICLVGQFNNDMQVGHRFLSDILPVSADLEVPTLEIQQSGDNIILSWQPVDGATSYIVEASDNPYSGFSFLGSTNNTTFSTSSSPMRKFFRVKALAQ
ncbi:MAG: chitobiase/beta-hexosaminidase C-terminal domain-containing protein [Candidatus Cloacimonetes bacterium]|nr:chitobiase/beta-hexosaminidase C-terminal domain-containing protein [Candidatus Cloacimonadota bacterium]